MKNTTLSVAIATYNEESNIKRCLDALQGWVDEIIIVDGTSTDQSPHIIKKYSQVKLISTTNKAIFHINKQIAIDACTSDWILQLDADEVVSPDLKKEILATISHSNFDAFWIKRKNFFLGKFLTKGGVYPDPTIRLYRRGKARLPCLDVHEQAVVDGSVSTLKHDLLHFADPNFARYLMRNDRYSSLLAQQLFEAHTSVSLLSYFFLKPLVTFFSLFFRHRGYVDGFQGFVFAFYSALRFPSAYVKLFELKQNEKI